MAKPVIRAAYQYDADAVSQETGLLCEDKSLTQQSHKDEADINVLVRRFGVTGPPPADVRVPMYGDFTEVFDYRSAMEAVRLAADSFMAMPAETRTRFGNDPQQFLEFCNDGRNLEEMREMGLAIPKEMRDGNASVGESGEEPARSSGAAGGGSKGDQGAASGAASGSKQGAGGAPRGGAG